MRGRQAVPVALALVVVLAGCGAPLPLAEQETSEPEDREDATDRDASTPPVLGTGSATEQTGRTHTGTAVVDDDVAVADGDLAVDEDRLFARTERLLGADVEPGTVELRDLSGAKGSTDAFTPVHAMLGVGAVQLNRSRPAGITTRDGEVYFDDSGADAWLVERRLVHEFVHVVQFRDGWLDEVGSYETAVTRDFVMAYRSLAEGGAVYAADAYVERYDPGRPLQSALLTADYRAGDPAGNRLVLAPYHFGVRYVRDRVDSPRNLASVYRPVPRTSEQVLHNLTPGSEPPMDLRVDVETGETFDREDTDRMGEMFLRVVLRAELDRERADAAAAGWGTDEWLTFADRGDDRWGLAWVTRWDSPGEATEFVDGLRRFVDGRVVETAAVFRVVELGDDTVVLLAGDHAFVEGATVSGGGESVSVAVDADRAVAGVNGATLRAGLPARRATVGRSAG
jgi:hypothetical protein